MSGVRATRARFAVPREQREVTAPCENDATIELIHGFSDDRVHRVDGAFTVIAGQPTLTACGMTIRDTCPVYQGKPGQVTCEQCKEVDA